MADVEFKDEFDIATNYGLNKELFVAVLRVESQLDHTAINPYTMDYGIGQINYKTAEALKMDIARLTSDRAYSIRMSAIVLATFQRKFATKEPDTWVCRYNVGTAPILNDKQKYHCELYLHKIRIALGDW